MRDRQREMKDRDTKTEQVERELRTDRETQRVIHADTECEDFLAPCSVHPGHGPHQAH